LQAGLKILPANPRASYLAHQQEIDEAIRRVMSGGWYILGKETAAFEAEFANFAGISHAIGVGNGTDALELALKSCGVTAGDEVITVSHTAVATVAAIELSGAVPVFVDIDPNTYTMELSQIEAVLSPRTKAIVPVHLYGQPVAMPALMQLAGKHGLRVIEDCAQSLGAAISGRKTGAWGDLAAFSFYPTKNLGAIGDGGMVVTNDPALAEKVRLLREYGWKQRYVSEIPGRNSRLDEVQAAILRVKLRSLETANERRRSVAQHYNESLSNTCLRLPLPTPDTLHAYHLYVVAHKDRDSLQEFLRNRGIGTGIHYPVPVHQQPAYRGRLALRIALPRTEKAARQVLSLPLYPELTDQEAAAVSTTVLAWNQSG
jgi:dTDP-4-amino-4,6-dideoxygalactose transaminase